MSLAITPDGTKAYVVNQLTVGGTVSVINTSTNTVSATITVGTASRLALRITPDGTNGVCQLTITPDNGLGD